MKAQQALLALVLPRLLDAIEALTDSMFEPELDDEEIHRYLREVATEAIIDELVRLLTRDQGAASQSHVVHGEDGIAIDTLIASHDELQPDRVRSWFARTLHMSRDDYDQWVRQLPDHLPL